ncbi:maleylpyruvate isomerase family mycothiol-dependent enzyme [Longispora sp. K20-0274]|uniref:maleylpyruvate isomerase family mycothiol-dependent enzyme n=1 Tax=Longispora sp. K20-0274 TaxID=3088255 RepID=UPI00399A240C
MEFADFRARLADDTARLTAVATDLGARVPSCPDWTVEDLVRHVALVYLHKVQCMRLGKHPADWPPDLSAEPALALLTRAYAELEAEFAARTPESAAYTWFDPDQTVGFWIRRMAHEAAVHRVDAELAAGLVTPVAAGLATDGVDEVLRIFLAWTSIEWPEDYTLADSPTIEVRTGGRSWFVRPTLAGVFVDTEGEAATTVSGEPSDVLLWLWRRVGDEAVTITGDPAGAKTLHALLEAGTQ